MGRKRANDARIIVQHRRGENYLFHRTIGKLISSSKKVKFVVVFSLIQFLPFVPFFVRFFLAWSFPAFSFAKKAASAAKKERQRLEEGGGLVHCHQSKPGERPSEAATARKIHWSVKGRRGEGEFRSVFLVWLAWVDLVWGLRGEEELVECGR